MITLDELAGMQEQPPEFDMTEIHKRGLTDDEIEILYQRELRRSLRDLADDMRHF